MTALPASATATIPADPTIDTVPAASATDVTSADAAWIRDPGLIRPGDRIEVWEQGTLCHVGTVGQSAPHLGLLWILETGTGARRLVPVHGYRLRRSPAAHAA